MITEKEKEKLEKEYNRMTMRRITLLIIIAIFYIIFIFISRAEGRPEQIGIIPLNSDYLLGWNQGHIANETYFNRTTGLIQIANRLERTGDIKYEFGYVKKSGSTYTYYGFDSMPGNESYGTDFSTFYYASTSKNTTPGANWIYMAKNNSQRKNDDYVQVDYVFQSSVSVVGDYYFVTRLTKMDIGQDGLFEMSMITLANGSDEYVWNESGVKIYQNITRIQINGLAYGFDLKFPGGIIAIYNHTSPAINGDWNFLNKIGNIPRTKLTFTQYWIDVNCVISCPPGCALLMSSNFTNINAQQGKKYWNFACNMFESGLSCSPIHCNIGRDCGMYPSNNMTGGNSYYQVMPDDSDHAIRCTDANCISRPLSVGQVANFNVTASKVDNSHWQCCFGGGGPECSKTAGIFDWNTTRKFINVTLLSPANAVNTTNHSVFHACDANTTVDNFSVMYNGSVNLTVYNRNISDQILFDNMTILLWGCRACYGGQCYWNWNANRTMTVWIPWFDVILWKEQNNSNLSARPPAVTTWAILAGNTTGKCVDNQTYYLNGTAVYTKTGCTNVTYNFTTLIYGNYPWDMLACKDNTCRWNKAGNFSFFRNPDYQVIQWTPANNTNFTDTSTATIAVNTTGFSPVDNLTILVDGNNAAFGIPNLSTVFIMDHIGWYYWDVISCVQGYCRYNSILFFSFNTSPPTSGEMPSQYPVILATEEEPQPPISDFLVYVVAGIIIIIGLVSAILWSYQNRRRENVEMYGKREI